MYPYVLSRGKQIVTLTALLAAILLLAVSAPLYGQEQTRPAAISPEQAVAIATMQEVGRDDFRISDAGDEEFYWANWPTVAFNPDDNEYMVVWAGVDGSGAQTVLEYEIYAQRVDAATGQEVGPNDVRISTMGPDSNAEYGAYQPTVAYNSSDRQYLVVWSGEDDRDGLDEDEREVYGRLLDRAGSPLGDDDIRITAFGEDGDPRDSAYDPALIYNPVDNRYLVVFSGSKSTDSRIFGQFVNDDGNTGNATEFLISSIGSGAEESSPAFRPALAHNPLTNEYLVVWSGAIAGTDQEFEVHGQLLTATGAPRVSTDLRISDMGPDGDAAYEAYYPGVVYNATDNRYLVVWEGIDEGTESEIYGQFLEADGQESGPNDFRISHMGPDGLEAFGASRPRVAHDANHNRYFVVWMGENADPRYQEIFATLLDASGSPTGPEVMRISQSGPDGGEAFAAYDPAVAVDAVASRYMVVWVGTDDRPGLAPYEYEIFGQLVDASGVEAGDDDVLLSDMGQDKTVDVFEPQVAYNAQDHEYLVVWYADRSGSERNYEWEIFGQRVDAATGREVGPNDFRISEIGPDGDGNYDAQYPDVVYNSARNEYLVVWTADNNVDGQVDDDKEIYGRIVYADGTPAPLQVRISHTGPDGIAGFAANDPEVAYSPIEDRYLVTWSSNHTLPQADEDPAAFQGEYDIYGRVLPGDIALTFPTVRISHMGPDGDENYDAYRPRIAHDPSLNQYLVVWFGSDSIDGLAMAELEVYGQLVDQDGQPITENHFRISETRPDGNNMVLAGEPSVAYSTASEQYLVVWTANGEAASPTLEKYEVFGQFLDANGSQLGVDDFQISTTGDTDNPNESASSPSVSYEPVNNQFVVIWRAHKRFGNGLPEEFEIEAQMLADDGTRLLEDALRISEMGPGGDIRYYALPAEVSCATYVVSCLIVWPGTDNVGTLTYEEQEVFGQLLGDSAPPVALPDVFSTPQDTPLVIPAPGVLENDGDGVDDVLSAVLDGQPANGSLALEPDGAFTYTPDAGFTGTDAFTYHASDGQDESEPVTVTIEVTPVTEDPQPATHVMHLPLIRR